MTADILAGVLGARISEMVATRGRSMVQIAWQQMSRRILPRAATMQDRPKLGSVLPCGLDPASGSRARRGGPPYLPLERPFDDVVIIRERPGPFLRGGVESREGFDLYAGMTDQVEPILRVALDLRPDAWAA